MRIVPQTLRRVKTTPTLSRNQRKPSRSPGNAHPTRPKRPPQHPARRYLLDIGKHISLALTAAKYDFDVRDDGAAGGAA